VRSSLRRRRLVHDPPNLHRVFDDGDDLGGDLDGAFLGGLDDPVPGERFLDLGERPVRGAGAPAVNRTVVAWLGSIRCLLSTTSQDSRSSRSIVIIVVCIRAIHSGLRSASGRRCSS
jgi:hypothetical protein